MRLRYGYFITCTSVVKNDSGEVVEVHCTYDPATRGGNAPDGRKVKATIHWVSAEHAVDAEVRMYENLFTKEDPNDGGRGQDFTANLNPNSLEVMTERKLEPSLASAKPGDRYQFERLGYFCVDPDTTAERWYSTAPCRCATPGQKLRIATKPAAVSCQLWRSGMRHQSTP